MLRTPKMAYVVLDSVIISPLIIYVLNKILEAIWSIGTLVRIIYLFTFKRLALLNNGLSSSSL